LLSDRPRSWTAATEAGRQAGRQAGKQTGFSIPICIIWLVNNNLNPLERVYASFMPLSHNPPFRNVGFCERRELE